VQSLSSARDAAWDLDERRALVLLGLLHVDTCDLRQDRGKMNLASVGVTVVLFSLTKREDRKGDSLEQGFPTWGTCTPRGTFDYLKGYIYV